MIRMLLTVVVTVLLCASCESKNESTALPSSSSNPVVAVSPAPSRASRVLAPPSNPVIISLTQKEYTESIQMGKELLEEYQVQPGQTIRFPCGSYIFDSHGDAPVTSIKEAQSKYPDWPIPETLGGYAFQDLTLYRDRTTVVFPDTVPPPKAEIAVSDDEEPGQYFLCYGDASGRFVVNVIPATEDLSISELIPSHNPEYRVLPSCPNAWLQPACEEEPGSFLALLMTVESDRGYGFLIRKISGADCLESESVPFTEEEAQAVYTSICDEFSR